MAEDNVGYRVVHPDGTVEFTDEPTQGGQEIKLHDVQTIKQQMDEARAIRRSDQNKSPKNKATYTGINIASPAAEQTFWVGTSPVSISVSVEPGLKPNHTVVVRLDGKTIGNGSSVNVSLDGLDRGTHTITASVIDTNGTTLISASPVIFYLRQHSAK